MPFRRVAKVAEMQLELERLMAENANLKTDVRRPSTETRSNDQLTSQCVLCAPSLPYVVVLCCTSHFLICI